MKHYQLSLAPALLLGLLLGCAAPEPVNRLKESWNSSNDPSLMGRYTFAFDAMPTEGQNKTPVWSGDYWPSYRGGLAQRWLAAYELKDATAYPLLGKDTWLSVDLKTLSPAEKYDLYTGHYDFRLTRWERERTKALKAVEGSESFERGFTIPSWEGLCHGWAPATIHYQEPQPVELSNPDGLKIPFGSADIKGLLSLLMHEGRGSRVRFLGQRCEADFAQLQFDLSSGAIDQATYDKALQSLACRDTNAGSFHTVLANELGLRSQAFLADVRRDREVWNQGLYEYKSEVGPVLEQATPGAAPGTVYEVHVNTVVAFIQESISNWEAEGMQDGRIFGRLYYEYRLELNAQREIIGGAWISEERPDFLWDRSRPRSSRLLSQLPALYKAATGEELF